MMGLFDSLAGGGLLPFASAFDPTYGVAEPRPFMAALGLPPMMQRPGFAQRWNPVGQLMTPANPAMAAGLSARGQQLLNPPPPDVPPDATQPGTVGQGNGILPGAPQMPPGPQNAPPPATPNPGGGFWSGLSNALAANPLTLMALGGGIMRGGLGRGLAEATPVAGQERQFNLQQQGMAGRYYALKQAGAPEDVARAAAVDSATFGAVAPRYLGEQVKTVPWGATLTDQHGKVIFQNNSGDMLLDEPTLTAMAHQYMAGDTSVLQNLGRGAQGAQNIVALRKKIADLNAARGVTGEGQAATNAEFFGTKAGERTLGNRTANIEMAAVEFQKVAPLAIAASNAVDRTRFPTLNAFLQWAEKNTGDPKVVQLSGAINSLVNVYARAISPTGTPTVSDKDHAREIMSQYWSKGQVEAGIEQMQKEIAAARQAPGEVRRTFRDAVTGGGEVGAMPATPAGGIPNGWSVTVK